jgi:RimJ/RimL family protein N-acetyltransferase
VISLVPASPEVARAVVGQGALPEGRVADWPHAGTAAALRPLTEDPGHMGAFLVCLDGVVVGECGWFGPPADDGEVEISFGLAPSARRAGIGAQAVRQLRAWAVDQGARVVRAEVLPGNAASFALLQSLGFIPGETRAGHVVLRWVSP